MSARGGRHVRPAVHNERVVPMSSLRNTYPWKAVGKLFFTGATAELRLLGQCGAQPGHRHRGSLRL